MVIFSLFAQRLGIQKIFIKNIIKEINGWKCSSGIVIEHLLILYEVLSLNPNTGKKKKKKECFFLFRALYISRLFRIC